MPETARVEIPRHLWQRMVDHARAEAPREAVGLIGGQPEGRVQHVCPLDNIAGPFAFFADPYQQYQAERHLRAQQATVLGYYHSHPGGGVDLSDHDRHFARRTDWVYVVIAIGRNGGGTERTAAYRWIGGALREVAVVVGGRITGSGHNRSSPPRSSP